MSAEQTLLRRVAILETALEISLGSLEAAQGAPNPDGRSFLEALAIERMRRGLARSYALGRNRRVSA